MRPRSLLREEDERVEADARGAWQVRRGKKEGWVIGIFVKRDSVDAGATAEGPADVALAIVLAKLSARTSVKGEL
jgi:hypothetical protein